MCIKRNFFLLFQAQLRASIFLALDEDEKISKQKPLLNTKIKGFMESDEGKTMFYIVHEFLEFFNLCFTLAVYEPESYIDCNYKSEEKQRLLNQFGLGNIEESNEPVLYQLLKIAQRSKKNLEVNININGNLLQENKPESIPTESSVSENICSDNSEEENIGISLKPKNGLPEPTLNATFDVQSPMYSKVGKFDSLSAQNSENLKDLDSIRNKKQSDDTYDDTSSLVEDVDVELTTQNSSSEVPERKVNGIKESEIVKDKPKMSPPKSEKLKCKSNLSSLSDLPPLNKSRVSDILPSLYNKDFKDKSNLRDLDKLFDMDAEFEEDSMYSSDDLPLKSDHNSVSLLEELQQSNKSNKEQTVVGNKEMKPKNPSRIIADCKFKTAVNTQKNKLVNETLEMNGENVESASDSV
ncbi:unnamed protein product [Psylliodes chrysocephalus]|uniref:FGFR1 oncogene partner (FOP) N-terminal dimerisation domain-containing protein n=1 Tax=Psylliodes chrysocephalus TaxID=3402493 RepID=A0A9P0GEZ7_9CUCU|nr:unnamed protein product [Psylliodes chrysocephala]